MSNNNSFSKKFKKQYLIINNSIENYFNKLSSLFKNKKNFKFNQNNRVFLSICVIVFLTLSYLLLPTIFNKNKIQLEIKNYISKKYDIELKFNEKIRYVLFPKPHYSVNNLKIISNEREIGIVENLKVFISTSNFFNINEIQVEDLVFKQTDFKITKEDFSFFLNLLKTAPNENNIIFKNSNIFFKNNRDEVLFINKISDSKFFYDSKNLENILLSNNEIFNIPFKLKVKNNKFDKEVSIKFNSKKIRLTVENLIDYSEIDIKGLLDILFVNKNTSLGYIIQKDSIKFFSEGKDIYEGLVDFKPFYLTANFDYDEINTKNLLDRNSIIVDLIKSEFLNNKNLNAELNLNTNKLTNIEDLNNLSLKINFEEGNISFSNSHVMWKNDLKISLIESLVVQNNGEITLIGKTILKFKNLKNFYRYFQIKKENRKIIKEIQFDFVYNLDQKKISFDNVKIDNLSNESINKYINSYNKKKVKITNKVKFKNFVNNLFSVYEG